MKTIVTLSRYFLVFLCLTILTSACTPSKAASFDQFTYQKTIEIKIQSESLLQKSHTPYKDHLKEIGTLLNNLSFILEYEKNRPHNEISYAMWKLLSDKDKNLLVGFLNYWKQQQQLSPVFIQEAQNQIQEAFDLLIEYEIKKNKTTKENVFNFINAQ